MSTITTRSGKGSPLTNSEVDANFTNLNTDKLENINSESIKDLSDVYSSMSPSDGQALVFDSTNGWQAETIGVDTSSVLALSGGTMTGDLTISSSTPFFKVDASSTSAFGYAFYRGSTKKADITWNEGDANLKIKNYRTDTNTLYGNIDFFVGGSSTNPSHRMRLDTDGNLLVGKTSAAYNTDGFEARQNGETYVSRSGTPMAINRNSSFGTLLNFYKDGGEVGSISTASEISLNTTTSYVSLKVNGETSGIQYSNAGTRHVGPWLNFDGAVDLGRSNGRFKDLYLSGTINKTAGSGTFAIETSGSSSVNLNASNSMKFTVGNTDSHQFINGTTTAMTLDSSGNLIVGKTSTDGNTAGGVLFSGGDAEFVKASQPALYLNRLTSDGDIIEFRKDGTTVGSISVGGGNAEYRSASALSLRPNDGTSATGNSIWLQGNSKPWNNAYFDLGSSTYKWKDLHLSGAVNAATGTYSGDVLAAGLYVGSANTSYDFYNNGTTYLNGATTIDDNLLSGDIHIKSGTSGTNTQGLLFTLTDNADAQAYIKKTSYYMHYNAHQNEGHRFTVHGGDDLLRMHGANNGTRPDSIDILAANGLYMGNTQVMTLGRALTNITGATINGNLTLEDGQLYVGNVSADNWTRVRHIETDGYGFDWQHSNASVIVNEQGGTNQALVLGDVDGNGDYTGLFGVAHSTNTGSSWTKKLDLRGNGELYIGSSGTSKVWHQGNDGSGSGLDADLWDGNQFSTYLNQSLKTTNAPTFAGATFTGDVQYGTTSSNTKISGNNDLELYSNDDINLRSRWIRMFNGASGTTEYARIQDGNGGWMQYNMRINNGTSGQTSYGLEVGGTTYSTSDMRSPIFYDSNSTSYYLDPASTGTSVRIAGQIDTRTQNSTTQNNQLYFGINNGNSAATSNNIGTGITWAPLYTGYTKRSAGILQIGEGNYFRSGLAFYTNNTADATTDWVERMRLDMDGNLIIGQAEISYTSNDNTPLVGSNTNNRLHVNGSIQLTNNNDAIVFGRGTSTFIKDEEIGFGWGGGWYMTDSSYLRVRNNSSVYSTGDARFSAYYDSNNTAYYVDPASTSSLLRTDIQELNVNGGNRNNTNDATVYITATNNNDWGLIVNKYNSSASEYGVDIRMGSSFNYGLRVLGAGSTKFVVDSNKAQHNTSVRAPIFYDSDNTSYYTNPAGSSRMSTVDADEVYNYGWFRNRQAAHGLYNQTTDSHFFSAGTTYWHINSANTASGGLIFYKDFNGTQGNATNRYGYVYWDSSGFGLLSSDGTWAVRTTTSSTVIDHRLDTPIMYDSNNTAYYVDPHSISNMYRVQAADWLYAGGNSGLYFSSWGGGFHMTDSTWVRVYNGKSFYQASGTLRCDGDIRAPIFYDQNDTNYYVNPASTSNLNALNVGGNAVLTTASSITASNADTVDNLHASEFIRANAYDQVTANTHWLDNKQIIVGGSNDMRMYCDNTDVKLEWDQGGAGSIVIGEDDLSWKPVIEAYFDLNNPYAILYRTGVEKLRTTISGITVTGDVNSTSDIRYKKNVETIDDAITKVQALRGVTFDWDNDAIKTHNDQKPDFVKRATGVIAQDVEKVLPEAVHENEDGYKNVAYGNMIGLLIEAIKEQQEQIDALKKQLNS